MIFFLVKTLSVFVYPIGMAFLLVGSGISGWLWGRRQRTQNWGKRAAAAGLAVLYIFSNGLVAEQLARSLERQHLPPDPMRRADGVIVLGGGVSPRAFPRQTAEVGEAGDRLLYGAHLLRKGVAKWMVYSAAGADLSYALDTEAEATEQLLQGMDLAEGQVIIARGSRNTRENATQSLPFAVERNAKTVLLVTSASHMPRSLRIFKKQAKAIGLEGLEIIPAPCDYAFIDRDRYPPWYFQLAMWFLPTSASLDTSTRIVHEYYGMAYYWLRGWI